MFKIKWDKVKEAFTTNINLKLIAVASAIFLWIVVVNIEDPTRSKFFTAKVQVTNEDVLTNAGKYYELPDDEVSVTFRVTAKRSVIEKLSNADFTATADLNYLSNKNKVPINIEAKRYSGQINISSRSFYLDLIIGRVKEKRFSIKPLTKGKPMKGIVIGSVKVTPNVVTVRGPNKIVSKISYVTATADVKGIAKNITESVVPVLRDKAGKEVDTSRLKLSVSTVEVQVDVGLSKKVPVVVKTSGSLQKGYTLEGVYVSPKTVLVQGDSEVLNTLNEIVIPSDIINLSNTMKDIQTTVDISSYLPEGIQLVNPEEKMINVKVKINSETSKKIDVPTENLTVSGIKDTETYQFLNKTVRIEINGNAELINKLDESKVTGHVDVSGLTTGVHQGSVELILSNGLWAEAKTTPIKISEK